MSMVKANPYDLTPDSLHNLSDLVREDGNYNEGRLADTLDAAAERLRDLSSRDSTPPPAPSAVHPLLVAYAEAAARSYRTGGNDGAGADSARDAWERQDCPIYAEIATPSPAPPAPAAGPSQRTTDAARGLRLAGSALASKGHPEHVARWDKALTEFEDAWDADVQARLDAEHGEASAPTAPLSASEREAAEAMREVLRYMSGIRGLPGDLAVEAWDNAHRTPSPAPTAPDCALCFGPSHEGPCPQPAAPSTEAPAVTLDEAADEAGGNPCPSCGWLVGHPAACSRRPRWSATVPQAPSARPVPSTEAPAVPKVGDRVRIVASAERLRDIHVTSPEDITGRFGRVEDDDGDDPDDPVPFAVTVDNGRKLWFGAADLQVIPKREPPSTRPVPSVEAPPARTVRDPVARSQIAVLHNTIRELIGAVYEDDARAARAFRQQLDNDLAECMDFDRDQDRAERAGADRDGGRGVKRG